MISITRISITMIRIIRISITRISITRISISRISITMVSITIISIRTLLTFKATLRIVSQNLKAVDAVSYFTVVLSVIRLNVVMLSVVVPFDAYAKDVCGYG
jgi:hypothetical protein